MKLTTLTCYAALAAFLVPSLYAAPPANDNFANATEITGTAGTSNGTNVEATLESGEPNYGFRSIWYSWIAPSTGPATVDTIGTGFDTKLAIYTGIAVDSLSLVVQDDDGSGVGATSRANFTATSGTLYRIQVTSYSSGHAGAATVLNWLQPQPPANDNFASAQTITGSSGTVTGQMGLATLEVDESTLGNKSVWYVWTPPASGNADIDTIGSGNNTTLEVYTGTALDNLVEVASGDDEFGTTFTESGVSLPVTSGTPYYIRVASWNAGNSLLARLNWAITTPPANDDFADKQTITGMSGTVTGQMAGASLEVDESIMGQKSVWYTWTAPASGEVVIDTIGSGNDTHLEVYTGTALAVLTYVADGGDGHGTNGLESLAEFAAVSGTVYSIRVSTFSSAASLAAKVNWVFTLPPANDNFASRQALSGSTGSVTGEMAGGTLEVGETFLGSKSVWYTWTAPSGGTVRFDTIGSGNDTQLNVFTGTALDALTEVASSNDGFGDDGVESRLNFVPVASTVYIIRVATYSLGVSLPAKLNWLHTPPAVNDSFANATAITGTSSTLVTNNLIATTETGEPGGGLNSIWFTWTAPMSGKVVFDTLGSEMDTTLGIYTGTAVNALTQVAFNNDSSLSIWGESLVKFTATAGTVYRIRVAVPSGGTPGLITLNHLMVNQPLNDNFADAQVITGAAGTVSANTHEATIEELEPNDYSDVQSIWYAWTAPFTGVVTFDTEGSLTSVTLSVGNNAELENLNVVSQSSGYPAICTFPVISGTVYRISVGTTEESPVTLNWEQEPTYVPSVISLSAASYNGVEGGPAVNITLNRNGGTTTGPVNCYLMTQNGSASGSDYTGTFTQVNFADGVTTANVTIPILQDRRFEGEETFQVRLIYPSDEAAFGLSLATVNIADDEPFIPLKANYTGLIQVAPFDYALAGSLKINATGNGSFTGTLMIGGNAAVPLKGAFNAAGKCTLTVTPKTGGNVLLNLIYADNGNRIRALVSVGGKTADIQAWRIIFGGAVEINDKPFAFTARISAVHNAPLNAPRADGFLSITVGIKGDVKITGVLPDDTTITSAGQIGGYDVFPLYAALYGGKGCFCSDLMILENMGSTSPTAWFKLPNSKDKVFQAGFTQHSEVETSPYKFSKRDPILAAVLSTQGVADFFAEGPGLPVEGITQIFRLMEDNSIALPLNPQVKLTLKFVPATGFFTGTYQVSTEKPTAFKGAVYQTLDYASGFFIAPVTGGTMLTNGTVEFMPAY